MILISMVSNMKIQFTSKSNKITLVNKSRYSTFYDFQIVNTKSFIKLWITPKFSINLIGNKLLNNELSLKSYLRLKKKIKKTQCIKFKKDKNTKVLIENFMF